MKNIRKEGFAQIHVLNSPQEADAAIVTRTPMRSDRKAEAGPYDIIGDIHGCFQELQTLLDALGYQTRTTTGPGGEPKYNVRHPESRRAVFLGDLVDRGPGSPGVLRLVMDMTEDGSAMCVAGNHENKLMRKLMGRNVQVSHGLAETLEQFTGQTEAFRGRVKDFLEGLDTHYVLDEGKLVVAHAGLKEEYQGRNSHRVREFCLYGETTGETDEFGLPVRGDWAAAYRGRASVVYGHTPVPEAQWFNNTINVDTGCVFGGKLTALRYPERELVSTPATKTHYEPAKPIGDDIPRDEDKRPANTLSIRDVTGRRTVSTKLRGNVIVSEENAAAALEVMSRFAMDPRWLIYLPPTMSPCETSSQPGLLEHPAQAFEHYRRSGISEVICQEKHMGSRAIVIAGKDPGSIETRFGISAAETGACYTRTGRRFFNNPETESQFLERVKKALGQAGIWDELETGWVALDCELMPWSLKARELVRNQYAPVGAAAKASLNAAQVILQQAQERGVDTMNALPELQERHRVANLYSDAYARYCWETESLQEVKLAPFHLLASEGRVHSDKDHPWHMSMAQRLANADPQLIIATPHRAVTLDSAEEEAEATRWWEELTKQGGEGMVVKPAEYVAQGARGIAQPAVKCRGTEYLRIIYGPEYTLPENLERLRRRGLRAKRSVAMREFAIGLEGLERFVRGEPLHRVHECAFAVLALESEPVDPRL